MKFKIAFAVILLGYLVLLIVSRNPLIVDDVHPGAVCDELLEKADVLYVTPSYKNTELNVEWCHSISSLNKTIGMHGITHSYHEFLSEMNETDLLLAMEEFEECFREKPKLFRPPYNAISKENVELVESLGMEVYKKRYLAHPYCHCEPDNRFSLILNKLIGC